MRPLTPAAAERDYGRRRSAAVRVHGVACGPRVNLRANLRGNFPLSLLLNFLLHRYAGGILWVARFRGTLLRRRQPAWLRRCPRCGEWFARSAFRSRPWIFDRAG